MKKRKLPKEIRRWIRFFIKTNAYSNFDWAFMLDIEKEKLSQCIKFYSNNGCHVNNDRIISKMKLAVRLLDIARDEDLDFKGYINTKNMDRFLPGVVLYNHEIDILPTLRTKKAWYLYNKLRYYYMKEWWD